MSDFKAKMHKIPFPYLIKPPSEGKKRRGIGRGEEGKGKPEGRGGENEGRGMEGRGQPPKYFGLEPRLKLKCCINEAPHLAAGVT